MSAVAFARAAVKLDVVPGGGLDGVPGGGPIGVSIRHGTFDPRAGAGSTGVYGMKAGGYAWAFAVPGGEGLHGNGTG